MRLSIWLQCNALLEGYGTGMSGLSLTGATMWRSRWTETICVRFFFSVSFNYQVILNLNSWKFFSSTYASEFPSHRRTDKWQRQTVTLSNAPESLFSRRMMFRAISFHQYQESNCLHPSWIIIVSSPQSSQHSANGAKRWSSMAAYNAGFKLAESESPL